MPHSQEDSIFPISNNTRLFIALVLLELLIYNNKSGFNIRQTFSSDFFQSFAYVYKKQPISNITKGNAYTFPTLRFGRQK